MNHNPWIITLESVKATGLKRAETFNDISFLKKMAQELHILTILEAVYSVLITREKEGLRVKGHVKAHVQQACSVTLEPVDEMINESLDVLFLPDAEDPNVAFEMPEDIQAFLESEDPPEPLINNQINLYDIIREFIALGLDPFPRKAEAKFINPLEETSISPFAALAQLKQQG